VKPFDLGWVVALLEGEGCFYTNLANGGRVRVTKVTVAMTDLDVLQRLQQLCGGAIGSPRMGTKSTKQYWTWNLYAANAIALMERIKPHMSLRRRAKIEEVQRLYEEARSKRLKNSGERLVKLNKSRSYEERHNHRKGKQCRCKRVA
jgi:hypothetical protein